MSMRSVECERSRVVDPLRRCETLERAFLAAEYVEDAARIYRDALLVDEPYVLKQKIHADKRFR